MKTSILIYLTLAMGFMASAQAPVVTVRFANPQYSNTTQLYSLDVEFQSNMPNQVLFGMNVRFFYDDFVLEYASMGDFANGYTPTIPMPPIVMQSTPSGGSSVFGFPENHPFEFFNGAIQLSDSASLILSTTGWTRIFTLYFHVDDPNSFSNADGFCPSVIWDLEYNPANGGWLNGDDGVVITVVAPAPVFSATTTENVEQFNWQYAGVTGSVPYGTPVNSTCISTLPSQINVTGVISQGQTTCYNATQTLTFAGNGTTFIVQNGASVTMIAGQSIRYLPGTTVLLGGYMHGYITTTGEYCGQQLPALPSELTNTGNQTTDLLSSLFIIYPNPATTYFTVEQIAGKISGNVDVLVYGMHGEILMTKKMQEEKKRQFNLTDLPYGLYFVKVIADGQVNTFKLVKTK
jgi:hypothetical protein